MHMSDLMTRQVHAVTSGMEAEKAFAVMRSKGIHHLAVEDGGRIVGVLSERDLGGPRGRAARRGKSVSELMARDVVTVSPGTTVREAATKMRARSIGSVLVTDGKALCGIVTVSDLLGLLASNGMARPTANSAEGRPRSAKARSFQR